MTSHPVAPETPAGLEAMREAVARVIDRWAFSYGNPDYYGPDLELATYSARQRVALKTADALLGPDGPLASVMRERDEAVGKERDWIEALLLAQKNRFAAEAELATLKAAARDGEAARQEIERLRAALEAAETRFSDIAAGRAFQPRPHAATGATEARAALTATETRDPNLTDRAS